MRSARGGLDTLAEATLSPVRRWLPSRVDFRPGDVIVLLDVNLRSRYWADLQRARGISLAEKAFYWGNQQQAGSAIVLLEPVVAANPGDIPGTAAIARCYQVLEKPGDAAPLWREVLLTDERNAEALLTMSHMHHQAGQYRESLEFLDAYLELNEWQANAQGLRAQLLERTGELEPAIQAARLALDRDPTRVSAYEWLERASERANRPDEARMYRTLRERLQRRLQPKP